MTELESRFITLHPIDHDVTSSYAAIGDDCMLLAKNLDDLLPDSREKSLAITKLEEVMFWATAAIARKK